MKTKTGLLFLILLMLGVYAYAQLQNLPQNVTPIMVNVTGMVEKPGQYTLTVYNRLSDAVEIAKIQLPQGQTIREGNASPAPIWKAVADSTLSNQQALRNVRLTRGGQSQSYDLLSFYRKGELSQNPLLRDGDLIFVPGLRETITISGEVYKPGEYQYLPGDTIGALIELAGGLRPGADLSATKLFKYEAQNNHYRVQNLLNSIESTSVSAWDKIVVPGNSELRATRRVTIQGKVRFPGEYLVDPGMGIYGLLSLAGGPTQDADLASSIYLNQRMNEAYDAEFERLREMPMGSMTSMEYAYLRTKLRQIQGRYSVNISEIWQKGAETTELELHDGDIIYIPEIMNMIWVSGQVKRPGWVNLKEGENWQYYIRAAGGYASGYRSGRTRIIRAASGNWIKPGNNVRLEPGDTIFVPERIERDFWTDVKDIVLLATQLITIVVGVSALTK
ncbi:MAG: hypothetical protein CVU49_09715 [Candidatus Cloacimonetes bacterium HGW-Cloacimonetes-2]|jgi:protein involved in polysaccharide export with SLBB domain|nr:MAG: hypothetical protein CVU49_09715 [Candidatus Cloacimonetes bacterium HGW-Cloacimonetes-2]